MNETLSLRMTSEERLDVESAINAAKCEDIEPLSPSDFLRIAARLLVRDSRALADAIAASLTNRRLGDLDSKLIMLRLHAMALRLLMAGWIDTASGWQRFDDLKKPLWLWCLADGSNVRWGIVNAGPRKDADDFRRDLASATKMKIPQDVNRLTEWLLESKAVGIDFTFGGK